MVQIPWPFTNAPGAEAQEGAGKLINVFLERRGDEQSITWRRAPGAEDFISDPIVGVLAGSATFRAISSVVDSAGTLAGTAAVAGAGSLQVSRQTEGDLRGTADLTGVSAVKIAADGSMDGTSEVLGAGNAA